MDEQLLPPPLGEVLATVLPAAARRGVEFVITPADCWEVIDPDYSNPRAPRQQQLLAFLTARPGCTGADIVAAGFSRALLNKLAELSVVARAAHKPMPQRLGRPPLHPMRNKRWRFRTLPTHWGVIRHYY